MTEENENTNNVFVSMVIISYDPKKEQKYVISSEDTKIKFPIKKLEDYRDIQSQTISAMSDVFLNSIYALQFLQDCSFIEINSPNMDGIYDNVQKNIYISYGLMCPMLDLKDGYQWHPFDYLDANNVGAINIIAKTIERSI